MEQLKLSFTADMKGDTEPFEGDRLDSQDLHFFMNSDMDSIERRIIDWLESNHVEMLADPSNKQQAFFSHRRDKTLSVRNSRKSFSLSLDEGSPLYNRHKKGSSPLQKTSGFFSPKKNESEPNVNLNGIILIESNNYKSFSDNMEENSKNNGMFHDYCDKISGFDV